MAACIFVCTSVIRSIVNEQKTDFQCLEDRALFAYSGPCKLCASSQEIFMYTVACCGAGDGGWGAATVLRAEID